MRNRSPRRRNSAETTSKRIESPSRRYTERVSNRDYDEYEIDEFEEESSIVHPRNRYMDTERDQYRRVQGYGAYPGKEDRNSNAITNRSGTIRQQILERRRQREEQFMQGNQQNILMDENRSARKRRRKAERNFNESGMLNEHWPTGEQSSGSNTNNYRRSYRSDISDMRNAQQQQQRSNQRGLNRFRDTDTYAIRKGSEMYLPGYEDVDRDTVETRRRVDLHRGQDYYPDSLVNPNLYGGLPDEDYYENRSRESYRNSVPISEGRYYRHRRSENSSGENRGLRRTNSSNRRSSRNKSTTTRHNQRVRGWDL